MKERYEASQDQLGSLLLRLKANSWNKPGIRHQGLSQQEFSTLARSGEYIIKQIDNSTTVTHQCRYVKETYSFDENGRLIEYQTVNQLNDDFPIWERFDYDEFGRITNYSYSGDGESNPANGRRESYEYPEERPDDQYTKISENDFFGHQVRTETFEVRRAKQVLKRSGWL